MKKLTDKELLERAIKQVKEENPDFKSFDQHDWYGALESEIDALLMDYVYDDEQPEDYELILERLVFKGISKATKKYHSCDPRA